ncbi:group II intron maturase-specific domain-containing protein [Paraflavitalea pollutisoli]|uniref:group II intron maturase-specific domain-containing protein n=1 Tax=Paraflavitalea pollutisoli TaxID=3034143 RepID=UPI003B832853
MDKELEGRGLSFVRYADDISIYARSETAARRILSSVTRYIERKLLLKVNPKKTRLSRPEDSNLLGFCFRKPKGGSQQWTIVIARDSIVRVKAKCKEITRRNKAYSLEERISKLNQLLIGWVNYFLIARDYPPLDQLDGTVRFRLRMCIWKDWKTPRTRMQRLLRLGANRRSAAGHGHSYKSYHRIVNGWTVKMALSNEYFQKNGYIGFRNHRYHQTGKQKSLF